MPQTLYFHVFRWIQGETLNFCEIELGHKNTPIPLTLKSWHNYAIFSKYLYLTWCTKCKGLISAQIFSCQLCIILTIGCQGGSYMVWEINMGVCLRLEFDNIMFINCLGYDFYIYGAFELL